MKLESIDHIVDLYAKWGNVKYSEAISQTEHGVQCARLAQQDNSSPALVLAALLHDIGHLIDLEEHSGREILDSDTVHEATGGRALSSIMPATVRNPIVLHVAAKRWLCARQPGYFESLSPASVNSLHLQGGPMTPDQADHFEQMPGFADALALRLWDDVGKIAEWGGSLDEFESILRHNFAALQTS